MSRHIPYQAMLHKNRVKRINTSLLPSSVHAVRLYRESGGAITDDSTFGYDPLLMVQGSYK